MKALLTGASSGIGRDMARVLARYGIDLILVARRINRLQELKQALPVHVDIICMDLSDETNCRMLYERTRYEQIDILINNAGFGLGGAFVDTDLERELEMINTNIKAVHILTKFFLKDFVEKDYGYILNVASSAAFLPGPLMATYYSTKAYVRQLSLSIDKELRKAGSHVYISALCPGPVQTEFSQVAKVTFAMKGKTSMEVAKQGIDEMFAQHRQIIPGSLMKVSYMLTKLLPLALLLEVSYHIQKRKN